MRKSIFLIPILLCLLGFTGCNSNIKTAQEQIEQEYNISLSYSGGMIQSDDFYSLSDTQKYNLLMNTRAAYEKNGVEEDVTIKSSGTVYKLVYEDELYCMTCNGKRIYSRELSQNYKTCSYSEEKMVSMVREKITKPYDLYVNGDVITGRTGERLFLVDFANGGMIVEYH